MISRLKIGDQSRMALGEVVTGNYFQVLGVRAALGRTLLPADDQPGAARAVTLSHAAWLREYGAEPSAVGRTITVRGQGIHDRGSDRRTLPRHGADAATGVWLPVASPDLPDLALYPVSHGIGRPLTQIALELSGV